MEKAGVIKNRPIEVLWALSKKLIRRRKLNVVRRLGVIAFGVDARKGQKLVAVVGEVAVAVHIKRVPHCDGQEAQSTVKPQVLCGVLVDQFVLQAQVPRAQNHQHNQGH